MRCLLRDRRLSQGLSQYDLEVLSGVSKHSISAYENGRTEMNVRTAAKFAIILKCSIDDLFVYKRD
ncbi:helix-turn-helix transcriptional regulator [Bacillus sp. FSL K6-3431]|uniref:helix-turn-helix transcriptional regulator n=1 Tax=Bacillus sp. FSL K6-3431 TaxID=2921500 RepID=UPI004046A8F5